MNKKTKLFIKVSALVTYLGMITTNALANILPINNIGTGQVSDSYPNLFAPIGLTFSIWGLIYLLLAVYVIYQFKKDGFVSKVNIYFIISSLANILWIFAWHYDFIGMSLVLMLIILFCLIKIAETLNRESLSIREKFLIRLPFSVYFGWITVATIANVTTLLVSLNWSGAGVSNEAWTVVVLLVGTLIGVWRMFKDKALAYGVVFIWAYLGIYLKHTSPNFFDREYSSVVITSLSLIFVFIISLAVLIRKNNYNFKKINF
jgi:hypothetical protein